jgi:hypothetical protein
MVVTTVGQVLCRNCARAGRSFIPRTCARCGHPYANAVPLAEGLVCSRCIDASCNVCMAESQARILVQAGSRELRCCYRCASLLQGRELVVTWHDGDRFRATEQCSTCREGFSMRGTHAERGHLNAIYAEWKLNHLHNRMVRAEI